MRRLISALFSTLFIIGLFSCQKEEALENKRFVRVEPNAITISIGEDCQLVPVFDSKETAKGKFTWSISDSTVAMLFSNADYSCVVTGLNSGKTYLKIESEDKRLYYSVTITVLEEKLTDLRPLFEKFGIPVYSQGSRGTCSIFVITSLLEFEFARATGTFVRFSPEYLNWAANMFNGDQIDGSTFEQAVGGAKNYGICKEELMPYQPNYTAPVPSYAAKTDAETRMKYIEDVWIRPLKPQVGMTEEELAEIKRQISAGHPVAVGCRFYYEEDSNGIMVVPSCSPDDPIFGGHSIFFVGFHDNDTSGKTGYFILKNSWGPSFGHVGYGYMPYEYARKYCGDSVVIHLKKQ